MRKKRLSPNKQLQKAKKEQLQVNAKLKRAKKLVSEEQRKEMTRAKIIIGGVVLNALKSEEMSPQAFCDLLQRRCRKVDLDLIKTRDFMQAFLKFPIEPKPVEPKKKKAAEPETPAAPLKPSVPAESTE